MKKKFFVRGSIVGLALVIAIVSLVFVFGIKKASFLHPEMK